MQLVHFYAAGKGRLEPEATGSKRAQETGALGIRVENFADFTNIMDGFVQSGIIIDRMVIETHGSPGAIYFNNEVVTLPAIQSLAGRRYETVMADDARIFLNGCNIAATECDTGTCGPNGNGRRFLYEIAKVFLKRGGGRVGASTSLGLAVAPFSNKILHLYGMTVYVYIDRGGREIRIAAGRELDSPVGHWKVTVEGGKYFYEFDRGGAVTWNDDRILRGGSGRGTWRIEGSKLKIAWQSGGREEWDIPLTTKLQSGTWIKSTGGTAAIEAERNVDTRWVD